MKQGCYIGNTTEGLFQRGAWSPFSFLLFLFVPRLLSHSRFISICAGAEGRTFSISCLCWDVAGAAGRRTIGGREMALVAPGSHICAGPGGRAGFCANAPLIH